MKRADHASMDYEAPLMPCGCILMCLLSSLAVRMGLGQTWPWLLQVLEMVGLLSWVLAPVVLSPS